MDLGNWVGPQLFCVPFGQLLVLLLSTLLDFCWFQVWRVGVLWGCKLKFLLDRLCPITTWCRVVFLCLLAILASILMIKEGTSLVLAWKLHLQWLRVVFVQPWLWPYETLWQTIDQWCLLAQECMPWCGGIPSSWSLLSTCKPVLSKMMKAGIFWLIRGGLHLASHHHPSLSLRKAQCYVVFNFACGLLIFSSTSYEWVLLL